MSLSLLFGYKHLTQNSDLNMSVQSELAGAPVSSIVYVRRVCSTAMASSRSLVFTIISALRSFIFIRWRQRSLKPPEPVKDIRSILDGAAEKHAARCVITYPSSAINNSRRMNYSRLQAQARSNALVLRQRLRLKERRVMLLHFTDHLDNILWFWSVLYAGCIPVMSTPLTENVEQRQKYIDHLQNLLIGPLCITRSALLGHFSGQETLRPITVEDLASAPNDNTKTPQYIPIPVASNPAVLMLTSGSSGNAKAVCLSNEQIFASIEGKASVVKEATQGTFMNWIGLDHVAGLIEIHLQAMNLGLDQVHVQPASVVSQPSIFLNLVSRHRVSRSFAPNFFLAKLRRCIESNDADLDADLDLSCLSFLASGGESNSMDTCSAVASLLHTKYRAPANVVVPGFGMTETCAGAIFNTDCLDYDLRHGHEFASVGKCMPGIHMRVVLASDESALAGPEEPGDLEISGPVLFSQYYNNFRATEDAFTSDGWFKTGDQAVIDSAGYLRLVGRSKEVMNVNGVKYLPHELETTIESSVAGVVSSYTVCFSHQALGSDTEQICVFYLPAFRFEDSKARVDTFDAIVSIVMLQTKARPYILPLDKLALQKSTLGKISRAKIKAAYERGDYRAYRESNDEFMRSYKANRMLNRAAPSSETENLLMNEMHEVLGLEEDDIDIDSSIFGTGVTSVDLIRLKHSIEKQLARNREVPMATLLTAPSIRALATSIEAPNSVVKYNPVVKLQHKGTKTPLWLVHPGVGEVLVFLNLAKHFIDRPVYALRARGFNLGETYFESIQEAVSAYHAAIKETQPIGPYAIAGYSYGTMLAFETVKLLENDGDEVGFFGSFNLPPHIKHRMSQLIWSECLLHLSYFLELISETTASDLSAPLRSLTNEGALAHVVRIANPTRTAELSLTPEALGNWADLAFALQGIARDYEPSGVVAAIDVFFATPLKAVAQSRREWVEGPLSKWRNFVREEPRFHEVDGAHYTMIGPEHVQRFAKKLKMVLQTREI